MEAGDTLARSVYPLPAVRVWLKPESAYIPMASSLEPLLAAVAPDATVAALEVVPLLDAV